MAEIVVGSNDELAPVLRRLLDLADHPRDVRYQPGTRSILVPSELADRFVEASVSEPDATLAATEETPAPRPRRRPSKAASKSESAGE
jgi:hypothetical protein